MDQARGSEVQLVEVEVVEKGVKEQQKRGVGYPPPSSKKNTKLLEFRNDITELMEGKVPGSLKVNGNDGRIVSQRIVSVTTVKKGYMAPVVKGTSRV